MQLNHHPHPTQTHTHETFIINAIHILYFFFFFFGTAQYYIKQPSAQTHTYKQTSPTTSSPSSTEHTKKYNKTRIILIIFFTRFVQMFAFCFFFTLFSIKFWIFFIYLWSTTKFYGKWQFYQLKYTFCSESDFYPFFWILNIDTVEVDWNCRLFVFNYITWEQEKLIYVSNFFLTSITFLYLRGSWWFKQQTMPVCRWYFSYNLFWFTFLMWITFL